MNSSSSWRSIDALWALRMRKDMVILLNDEVRPHPGRTGTGPCSSAPTAARSGPWMTSSDLYQVLFSLAQRLLAGKVCRVAVPEP
jgi:hypothetical protein